MLSSSTAGSPLLFQICDRVQTSLPGPAVALGPLTTVMLEPAGITVPKGKVNRWLPISLTNTHPETSTLTWPRFAMTTRSPIRSTSVITTVAVVGAVVARR